MCFHSVWIILDCSSTSLFCFAEGDSAVGCSRVLCCLHPNLRYNCQYCVPVAQGKILVSFCYTQFFAFDCCWILLEY